MITFDYRGNFGGWDTKELLFYSIAGTIIGLIAQALGATLALTLLTSLIIPPLILLVIRIIRY